MIRTVAKNRLRQNLISDPMRNSAPFTGGSGDFTSAGARFIISSHTPNSGRHVISGSPLAKLSMSSSLEDGGNGGGVGLMGGFMNRGLTKRRTSENSVESSREDCLMESDNDSVNLEESGETAPPPSSRMGDKTLQL